MKYGKTLQQRSIPLWETYNIDYNDIKHLIKVHTTKGQAQAIAIPGKDNEAKALEKFEDELYDELRDQHQRIDLFVQSKSGEITRRLVHLERQIAHLGKPNAYSKKEKIPVRRLEKFAKIEEETLKAGEEVQSLSRFVGAQRLAFQKLLKKYKKWTGSSELGKRFYKDVLGRPSSFSRRDFGPLLTQWTEVLAAVRAPFSTGAHWQAESDAKDGRSGPRVDRLVKNYAPDDHKRIVSNTEESGTTAALIHSACENGSSIDVDTALATLPLGTAAGKASYWIHHDHLVEIQVLLLQYTRLWKPVTSNTSSPRSSPTRSFNGRSTGMSGLSEHDVGVIICDDLQRFAKMRSAATISDSENIPGMAVEKAAASIRYASKGKAVVVVSMRPDSGDLSMTGTKPGLRKGEFKRKAWRNLFDMNTDSPLTRVPSGSYSHKSFSKPNQAQSADLIRSWLNDHSEVQPLVQIQLSRSRFAGLGNSESSGVWVTLDKDVYMRLCSPGTLLGCSDPLNFSELDSENFPHAVLEVRYEGEGTSKLVTALDASHLTERVRGFSLETHAVATLCKPQGMPPPFWLPALNHDIRKIPAVKSQNRRASNSQTLSENASTRQTSASGDGPVSSILSSQLAESSATSAPDLIESPPISALKKKRTSYPRTEHPLSRQISEPANSQHQRYWNEFDDGDEASTNEAYTIFVDPHAASIFPGAVALDKAIERMAIKIKSSTQKFKSWLRPSTSQSGERQPLIEEDYHYGHYSAEDETDLDYDAISPTSFPHRPYPNVPAHVLKCDRLLSRSCLAFFVLAFGLLLLASVALMVRKRGAAVVDLGAILAVIASLIFTVMAVGTMVLRSEDLGWVYRATVMLLFALDCVGCVVLVMALGSA